MADIREEIEKMHGPQPVVALTRRSSSAAGQVGAPFPQPAGRPATAAGRASGIHKDPGGVRLEVFEQHPDREPELIAAERRKRGWAIDRELGNSQAPTLQIQPSSQSAPPPATEDRENVSIMTSFFVLLLAMTSSRARFPSSAAPCIPMPRFVVERPPTDLTAQGSAEAPSPYLPRPSQCIGDVSASHSLEATRKVGGGEGSSWTESGAVPPL